MKVCLALGCFLSIGIGEKQVVLANDVMDYTKFASSQIKPVEGVDHFPHASLHTEHGTSMPRVDGIDLVRLGVSNTGDEPLSLSEKAPLGFRILKTQSIPIGGPSLRQQARGELDASMFKLLNAIPDAKIFVRVSVEPTVDFLQQHPESHVTGSKGQTQFQERFNRYFEEIVQQRPSWASMSWRKWVDREIIDLLTYAAAKPYAQNIIGVLFTAGHTGEFDQWFGGEGWPGGNDGDWAPESQQRFQQWLAEKYQQDVARLQQAWKQPDVTFATAQIALQDMKMDQVSSFYDPTSSPARADYMAFRAQQIPETIESWCRTAKLASGGRLLCGAMTAVGEWSGSDLLMTTPWVDYGAGPGTYFYREPGNHTRLDLLAEEYRRNNKWFFNELDYATWQYQGKQYKVETPERTIAVLKREHAQVTLEGSGGYWYEFRGVTYRDQRVWDMFRKQADISELASRFDVADPGKEVLVVFANDPANLAKAPGDLRTNVLSRLGTPFDGMLLGTLVRQKSQTLPYKVVIFVGIAEMTTAERQYIKTNLMQDGRTLVFLRPCGSSWPEATTRFSLANSTDLHGIALASHAGFQDTTMRFVDRSILKGLTEGQPLLDPDDVAPPRQQRLTAMTVVKDEQAVPIAIWSDHTVAAAMKKYDDWTAVYIPGVNISSPVLRSIIRYAGAHQYVQTDDIVYAGRKMLAIHTRTDGQRVINLPTTSDLYDLYADQMVGQGQRQYQVGMKADQTRLFFLGDPRESLKQIHITINREIAQRLELVQQRQQSLARRSVLGQGPFLPLDNGKIRHYLFLGPVFVDSDNPDEWREIEHKQLLVEHLKTPVAQLRPFEGQSEYLLSHDESLQWKPAYTGTARLRAGDFVARPDRRYFFYVATYLQSEIDQDVELYIRTERGYRAFFDGQFIGGAFYTEPQDETHKVHLKAGHKHCLLMKIFSAGGANTGWMVQMTHESGSHVEGVKLYLAP
jgi:hypothetical protein